MTTGTAKKANKKPAAEDRKREATCRRRGPKEVKTQLHAGGEGWASGGLRRVGWLGLKPRRQQLQIPETGVDNHALAKFFEPMAIDAAQLRDSRSWHGGFGGPEAAANVVDGEHATTLVRKYSPRQVTKYSPPSRQLRYE